MAKFIVVVGGVISGVGKGITTASIGRICKEYGFSTTIIKIDPYLNVDAGTLRPTEHGEVWVTEDGGEVDQDLGNYERFMDQAIPKKNSITTGQIYQAVINRERHGGYLGATVQSIPHIPLEIKDRILQAAGDYEIALVEIGGIVGDYENVPFLFATRGLQHELGNDAVAHILVSFVPATTTSDELKTKPTQQAIKLLRQEGIIPDIIVCRSKEVLDLSHRKKIEATSYLALENIISAPDVQSIYEVPLYLEEQGIGKKLCKRLGLVPRNTPSWENWKATIEAIKNPQKTITIGIIGKYLQQNTHPLTDSYISIEQSITHAAAACNRGVSISWIDACALEQNNPEVLQSLSRCNGIIVPGGFGSSGIEGKLKAIEYARTKNVPYLGICYGLQLATIEYARNVCSLADAHTTEVNPHTPHPVVNTLTEQKSILEAQEFGGSMRLGIYEATLSPKSGLHRLYKRQNRFTDTESTKIIERHRHRYEVNSEYIPILEKGGLFFSGYYEMANGNRLVEFLELPSHPFFVATQAHPEFISRLGNPHPLFIGLIEAATASCS